MVTSIPDVKENKAKLINGIYVSDNPSNVNGENVLVINKSSGLVVATVDEAKQYLQNEVI